MTRSAITRRLRLRRSRVLVALAAVVLLAGGCVRSERSLGVQTDTGPQEEGDTCLTPLEEADGPVTLEVWHALNAEAKTTLEELAQDFNASQDQVRVTVRSQGTLYEEVRQAYIQGIAGGRLPGLVHVDANDMQLMIDTNTVAPAQECFDAEGIEPDVIPSVQAAFTREGTYWPTLATVSTNVMYYNQAHFQRAGLDPNDPPETLAEVEEVARTLKAEGGIDKPLSLLLSPGFIEYWAGGVGEQLINEDNGRAGLATEANFDNPATREAFEWIDRMISEGLAQPYSTGGIDQYLAVATEQSSMLFETSTSATTIAAFLSGELVDTGGVAAPADIPTDGLVPMAAPYPGLEEPGRAQIGGGAFFMPATNSAEVQAAAWAFSQYMASPEGQLKWHTEGSYLPTVIGATEDPDFLAFWESGLAGRMLKVASDQLQSIDPERPGPLIGPRGDYGSIVEAALGKVAFEGADPDGAVETADRDLTAALLRYVDDNG